MNSLEHDLENQIESNTGSLFEMESISLSNTICLEEYSLFGKDGHLRQFLDTKFYVFFS
jgi:hypothetical protein